MSDRRRRGHISLTVKLAATLLELRQACPETGQIVPLIDREHAKLMTAEQICSLFQFDHAARWVDGGSDHPTNLTPTLIPPHREKTRKIDIPAIRKGDRIDKVQEAFRAKMLAKAGLGEEPAPLARKWGSRPMRKAANGWGWKR